MGSWEGHVLPGSFFIYFGLVWAVKWSYRNFNLRPSHSSQRSRCRRFKWDVIEAATMIFTGSFGLIIEQMLPWEPQFHVINYSTQEFSNANNWQHSTMYAFFVLSGILQILVIKIPKMMPHCIHHISFALAFGVEGYLFFFHTHGREELDVRLHVLLLFSIWPTSILLLLLAAIDKNENISVGYAILPEKSSKPAYKSLKTNGAATSLLQNEDDMLDGDIKHEETSLSPGEEGPEWTEMTNINNNHIFKEISEKEMAKRKKIVTLHLLVSVLQLLQGFWFWQVAYVLYPPAGKPWEEDSHKNIAFATMFFTWYIILAICIVTTIYCLMGCFLRRRGCNTRNYSALQSNNLP